VDHDGAGPSGVVQSDGGQVESSLPFGEIDQSAEADRTVVHAVERSERAGDGGRVDAYGYSGKRGRRHSGLLCSVRVRVGVRARSSRSGVVAATPISTLAHLG